MAVKDHKVVELALITYLYADTRNVADGIYEKNWKTGFKTNPELKIWLLALNWIETLKADFYK